MRSVTPIPYSEMASSSYLAPNPSDPSGRIPYRYSTSVDWRAYNKVTLEPVVIYRGPDQQFSDMSEADRCRWRITRGRGSQRTGQPLRTRQSARAEYAARAVDADGAVVNTPVLGHPVAVRCRRPGLKTGCRRFATVRDR